MRLNVGCGPVQPEGWVNVDNDPQWIVGYPDVVAADPLGPSGLPFPDGTFDGAVANHVLQMVAWPDLVPWLGEVRRVLADGARLRLLVPDLLGAVEAFYRVDKAWFPIDDGHEPGIGGKLCMYVTQAGATRSVFTRDWLCSLCLRAGFRGADVAEPGATFGPAWLAELDSRDGESIVVEAVR